jgi:integrase
LHERDLSRGVEGLQVTVDEFLDHWLKTAVKPKVRGKTYGDYAAMLRRYIRPAIGARTLAALSPLEIQAAYQGMIDRKLSARTVRYAHAVLRAAIRQAIRWQLLLSDPTQGVELPREQCGEMSVLTTEQARSFLRAASHSPQGCLFAVALTTGMRPSEQPTERRQQSPCVRSSATKHNFRTRPREQCKRDDGADCEERNACRPRCQKIRCQQTYGERHGDGNEKY